MQRVPVPKDAAAAAGLTLNWPASISAEAAAVLNHAVGEARRRNHRETTPLHVAAAALAHPSFSALLLNRGPISSPSALHELLWRRLELCFAVALDRLYGRVRICPLQEHFVPVISKSLTAALSRAQPKPSEAAEIKLEELICSILGDQMVVRVLSEAGFSSAAAKVRIKLLGAPKSTRDGLTSAAVDPNNQRLQLETEKEVNRAVNVLLRGTKRNPILVGESGPYRVARELLRRLEDEEIEYEMLKNVQVIDLEKEFPLEVAATCAKIMFLCRIIQSSERNLSPGGVIIHLGDLKWLVKAPLEFAEDCSEQLAVAMQWAMQKVGTLLKKIREGMGGGRIWLIGTASCETYMRCQGRHPDVEDCWDLHPLLNAADSTLSGMASILRQDNVAKQRHHDDVVKPVDDISRAEKIPFPGSRSESVMEKDELWGRLEGRELRDGMLHLKGGVDARIGNVDSGGKVSMVGPTTQETNSRSNILDHTMANHWNLQPVPITVGAPLSVMLPSNTGRRRFETGNHDQVTCVPEQMSSMTSLMPSAILNIVSRDDLGQYYSPQLPPKALSSNPYRTQLLVHLILPNFTNTSSVKQFQSGGFFKYLVNLKLMDLSDSSLTRLPETSAAQKLEILNLSGCVHLLDVLSIHQLSKLQQVKLRGCISVRRLPSLCNLRLLKILDLSNCSRLNKLPPSMGHLSGLISLDLTNCRQLERLPGSIFKLKLLETFSIAGCSCLMKRLTIGEKQAIPSGSSTLFSKTCGTEAKIISHQTSQIEMKFIPPQPEAMEWDVTLTGSHTTPQKQPESVTKVPTFIHSKTKKQLGLTKPKHIRTSFKPQQGRVQVFSISTSPQDFREAVEALTAGGCPSFLSTLAGKKKDALRDYLTMSLEHIHFLPDGFLSIETVVHSLLGKHRASLSLNEQIALQAIKHSLAELSRSFPGIVMSMKNAEAEKTVLVAKSMEVEARLAFGEQELASVEAEFSKVLEEEEILDAEIHSLIAKKLEMIGARVGLNN
ncbi:unnamed protein product [Linum tenue]|uniref:SMAX1-like nucleotide binding domain-containing protein n=1 Tax=Linum tenue TaxID=586396 RepID=A0AAV0L2P7_9ROSI|nr:unnamed protein product [Linum tenue]